MPISYEKWLEENTDELWAKFHEDGANYDQNYENWLEEQYEKEVKMTKDIKWKNIPVPQAITATMTEIDSIPAGDNPFRHDLDRCGVGIGYENEYVAMFHPSFMDEIIIVNRRNGRRYKINFQR